MHKTDKKIQWNDLQTANQSELKKAYKMSDRQLEVAVRHHLDGTNEAERRKIYQEFYGRRK